MKRLILSVIVMFLATLNIYSNGEAPAWFQSGELKQYPRDLNFTGIGSGDTEESAVSEALSMIAGQFSVDITSTVELFKRETTYNGEVDLVESFTSESTMYVKELIEGAEIVKFEAVGNTCYAFAALNKKAYANLILNDLSRNQSQVETYLVQAKLALKQGDLLSALQNYASAYPLAKENFTKTRYLDILRMDFGFESLTSVADIITEVTSLLNAINLVVVEKPERPGILGNYFDTPFVVGVTYSSTPATNLPVVVRAENGVALARTNTDRNGEIFIDIQAVPSEKNPEKGIFRVFLNLNHLLGEFSIFSPSKVLTVAYDISEISSDTTFSVSILDKFGEANNTLERTVESELRVMDIVIENRDPAYKILGKLIVSDEKQVKTYRGTQFVVVMNIELELVDASTGIVINSRTLRNNGISNKSLEDAARNAAQSIRLPPRFVAVFLRDVLE